MHQLTDQQRQAISSEILGGHKIEAIKLYREATGSQLVDAKKAVEELETRLRSEHPENFGPAASRTGCMGVVLLAVGVVSGLSFLTGTVVLFWK